MWTRLIEFGRFAVERRAAAGQRRPETFNFLGFTHYCSKTRKRQARGQAFDLIRTRTGEGRERAKARGVKLGRKPKLTEHQKREAIRRRDRDGETVREIARSYNVSHSTILRLRA